MKKGLTNYFILGAVILVTLVVLSFYYSRQMEGFYDVNPEQKGIMCKALKESLQSEQASLSGAQDAEHKTTITQTIDGIKQQMTAADCPQ